VGSSSSIPIVESTRWTIASLRTSPTSSTYNIANVRLCSQSIQTTGMILQRDKHKELKAFSHQDSRASNLIFKIPAFLASIICKRRNWVPKMGCHD
jgi:hypothetical protein